jgi:hypothetical protein
MVSVLSLLLQMALWLITVCQEKTTMAIVEQTTVRLCVGNVMRYPRVPRGTRRESSDVGDAVRQPVVTQIG